jgi:hypothetical protein
MATSATVNFEWSIPEHVSAANKKQQRRQFLIMAARTAALCALIIGAFFYCFGNYLPGFKVRLALAGGVGLVLFQLVPLAFLPAKKKPFALSDQGIQLPNTKILIFKWDRFDSFTIHPHPLVPHALVVHLHHKEGHTHQVTLPDDPIASRIIAFLSGKLPQRLPLPEHSPLCSADWIAGMAGVALYATITAHFMLPFIKRYDAGTIMLALMIVGPGTFCAMPLIKHRATPQLFIYANTLNMLGLLVTLLAGVLVRL